MAFGAATVRPFFQEHAMSETALYKSPGEQDIWGHKLACMNCPDDEVEARLAEGWHTDPNAAAAAGQAPGPVAGDASTEDDEDEATPPTRAELEAKARELGIEFDGRNSDKKLAAKITAALGV